jgi:hypothetical protein
MAHFAKLNNNIVEQVVVVNNDVLLDNGVESEQRGIDLCKSLYGQDTNWKQTSYNGNFRKNFAGIGDSYDQTRDAFIAQQPHNSWTLNETTCIWEAPVSYPTDGQLYQWNEETLSWVVVE